MRTRSWRLAGLAAIGACALAATAAVVKAPALVERALARALAGRGLEPSLVRVDRVGPARAHIAALHVGGAAGARLEDVTLEYSLAGLLRGDVARVEIGALALEATLVDGRVSLGTLDTLLADAPGTDAAKRAPAVFPRHLRIARLVLTLHSGAGTWRVAGPIELAFDARGVSSLAASLRARGPREVTARLEAHGAPVEGLAFAFDTAAPVGAAPDAARIVLASRGTLAAPWLRIWDPSARDPRVDEIEAEATFSLHSTALAWREQTLALETSGAVQLASGRFALALDAVRIDGLAARISGSARVAGTVAPARIERARVELAPYAEPGLALPALVADFSGSADAEVASGSVELTAGPGDASFGATLLRGARLAAALRVDATREAVALRLPECGELTFARVEAPGVRLGEGALCLRELGDPLLQLTFGSAVGGPYALRVESRAPLAARLGGGERLRGELPVVEVRGELARPGVSLALRGADLILDSQPFALRDADARGSVGDAGWAFELERARLEPREGAPLAAALRVSGRATGDAEFVRFELAATDAAQRAQLAARGVHRLASGFGVAAIELPPVLVGESGLRLDELLVDGAALPVSKGELGARGAIAWNPRQVRPDLDVSIARLDVAAEGVTLRGASAVVRLRSFDRLSTAPAQRVTADVLDVGIALAEPELVFELADGARLTIAPLAAGFAGGRLALRGVIDARESDQALALSFDTVDMAEILRVAEVDDVVARGRVSGLVPLALRDGQIRVLAGALRSTEGGVIQVPPDSSVASIGGSGVSGELVRDVLADFHFSELKVAIDGTLGGKLQLVFSIRGSNPAVQGGREIHLNLTVNETVVGAVEAQSLWRALMERMRTREGPPTVDSRAPRQENGAAHVAPRGKPS